MGGVASRRSFTLCTMSAEHPPIAAPLGDVMTDRLSLRRFVGDDLDELAAVFAHPEVWAFPYGRGFTRSETRVFLDGQINQWDDRGFGLWIARERTTGGVIGFVGFSVPTFLPAVLPAIELGWRLAPAFWGMGYATEGARAALDQAFTTMGLDRVVSIPQVGNPASSRVAERLGMKLVGAMPIPATERRDAVTGLLYEILRDAWSASKNGEPEV